MLGVDRSQHARQSLHWLSCSAAGQLLPAVTTVDVQGQKPGAGLSILCPDNLIIKFFGMLSEFNGKNLASLVGSQCLVRGVSLHTSKIFFKCNVNVRAKRRWHEYKKNQPTITLREVKKALKIRDYLDINRKHSPLRASKDSIVIDTSKLSKKQTLSKI